MVRLLNIKKNYTGTTGKLSALKATRLSLFLALALVVLVFNAFKQADGLKLYQLSGYAQGTTYNINYYHGSQAISKKQIDSILVAIDSSLSIYKDYSLITTFNQSARGLKMDVHLQTVVEKSLAISKKSNGAFDITVYPLVNAWGFGLSKPTIPPSHAEIKKLLGNTGYQNIEIKGNELLKRKPQIQIDVNGIAQGYSVDLIADFLEKNGVRHYMAELGGELRVKGKKPENQSFKIGIEAVNDIDFAPLTKFIEIDSGAITTSGNYRKFMELGTEQSNHIINPKTGYYQKNSLVSVTVYAPDAITADGYDNVLMNLGLEKSLSFLAKHKELAAYFVFKKDGKIKDTCSVGFPKIKEF